MKKHSCFKIKATALAVSLGVFTSSVLSGCGSIDSGQLGHNAAEKVGNYFMSTTLPVGYVSEGTKWVASGVQGVFTEDVSVDLKDDFFTAENREWLLSNNLPQNMTVEEMGSETVDHEYGTFYDNIRSLKERKMALLKTDPSETSPLSSKEDDSARYSHNLELLHTFADLAKDWDRRNEQGVEPARKYIEKIEQIDSLDGMTAFFCGNDGANPFGIQLFDISVDKVSRDADKNVLSIDPAKSAFVLGPEKQRAYMSTYNTLLTSNLSYKLVTDERVRWFLSEMGYSEGDIERILTDSRKVESTLAFATKKEDYPLTDEQKEKNSCTLDELALETGSFPIKEILTARDLDRASMYLISQPVYVKNLGSAYTEGRLRELKAFCITHTIYQILPLLDRETLEKYSNSGVYLPEEDELSGALSKPVRFSGDEPQKGGGEINLEDDEALLMDYYVRNYMGEILDQAYLSVYLSYEDKKLLTDLVNEIIEFYKAHVADIDWLSEDTRKKVILKLDRMGRHVLYPENMTDYSGLEIKPASQGGTLLDAVVAINLYNDRVASDKLFSTPSRDDWDLNETPTTNVNAYYMPSENAIYILAGVAMGDIYARDMEREELLGKIGAIIGHEVTHAFDENGAQYDENGEYNNCWNTTDKENFDRKAENIRRYYDSYSPLPGRSSFNMGGSDEATADMGGVMCCLKLAEKEPDFDYDKFFVSFAELYRYKVYESDAKMLQNEDEHPPNNFRVNVTLSQFDEFIDLYGIQEGDGMYWDPDERLKIW
ncbi:MAG: M13 family metallopeptidase [Lachnospiraceae bacterium]|nr:M13 family metallopeptidase [Lachnospiraceae bacterium]